MAPDRSMNTKSKQKSLKSVSKSYLALDIPGIEKRRQKEMYSAKSRDFSLYAKRQMSNYGNNSGVKLFNLSKEIHKFILLRYNVSNSGRLSLEELKFMMEKLGAPQTHLGLKAMIKVWMILADNFRYFAYF